MPHALLGIVPPLEGKMSGLAAPGRSGISLNHPVRCRLTTLRMAEDLRENCRGMAWVIGERLRTVDHGTRWQALCESSAHAKAQNGRSDED
jgi:hypothetical protein